MPLLIQNQHPLAHLAKERDLISRVVCSHVVGAIPSEVQALTQNLADCLFCEKKRLESPSDPVRDAIDRTFWNIIAKELQNAHDPVTLRLLLERIARFHIGEISGHFNEGTYKIATTLVPRGFYWLLQALSWRSLAGAFKQKVDLQGKVVIQGQLDQLRFLAKKGTILLVPTHLSNIDSILMGWALFDIGLPPFAYGAGLNLFNNPILAYFMNNLGAYKVDRKKKHGFYKEILKEYSTVILERGCHSLFFPGGGRSRSGGIERHIKLGLLGTGINAFIRNLIHQKENPNIYIVPCTMSYHSVLEASSLIEDHLREQGKGRYLPIDSDSITLKGFSKFIWNFFSTSSKLHVNFGRALDPFGNLVDDEGRSISASGKILAPEDFVKSNGTVQAIRQRDEEYTKILASRIVDRYSKENMVLSSHFLAYCLFKFLQKRNPSFDIYRLMQLPQEDRFVKMQEFYNFSLAAFEKLQKMESNADLLLGPGLKTADLKIVFQNGLRHLGVLHSKRPAKVKEISGEEWIYSEDMKLLYFYHNRMDHYELIK
jgi:glycerol-3-phosphate O-acyltransferase